MKEHFPVSAELGGLAMLLAIDRRHPARDPRGAAREHGSPTTCSCSSRTSASRSRRSSSRRSSSTSSRRSAAGSRRTAGTRWDSKVLPVIALSLGPLTYFARIVRGQMLETLQQDYVRTAKAKGLRWTARRHRARAAQLAHPGCHGGRPAPRLPRHGLLHHREHLRDPRDRPLLRDVASPGATTRP